MDEQSDQPLAGAAYKPGWYPDPGGERRLRWWDGTAWGQAGALEPVPGFDGAAIAALIFGILSVVIVSAICGIVALRRIPRTGKRGRGLAIAGLAVSGAWLCLLIGVLGLSVIARSAGGNHEAQLKVGGCLEFPATTTTAPPKYHLRSCTMPHNAQVVGDGRLTDLVYLGEEQVRYESFNLCKDTLDAYPITDDRAIDLVALFPSEAGWRQGDRRYVCVAIDRSDVSTPITGPSTSS